MTAVTMSWIIAFCVIFFLKLESLGMTHNTWKSQGILTVANYTYRIGGGDVVGAILALRILASNSLGLLDNKRKTRDISLDINYSKSLG